MRFATIFVLSVVIILSTTVSAKKGKKRPESLPPHCVPPPKKQRASKCSKGEGFKYNPKMNLCTAVKDELCQGHGGFFTLDECVYHCYDYRKMFDKKNEDSCKNPIKEEEMSPSIRVVSRADAPDTFKDNRCREPTAAGVKNGSDRSVFKSYKFNKDSGECDQVVDEVCRGRNRFKTREECMHVCKWNLSSGRHRYIVRESNKA